jgi:hypothetical protein
MTKIREDRSAVPMNGIGSVLVIVALLTACTCLAQPGTNAKRVHIIYGTDLFHPYDDPDDHYDLAALFAIPDFQIDAILLDLGDRQKARPGRVPLEQMFQIAGRSAPYATGLSEPLRSLDDTGMDRPADEQKAIELLLATLRKANEPVVMITAGSVRDVVAAFNREPDLLRAKLRRLYINIGSATDVPEWNVTLDLKAYLALMRSGLPLYWCPCEPQKAPHPHSTYWKFQQSQMLEGLPRATLNYFVYALQRVRTDELEPSAVLEGDLSAWRQLPGRDHRNMWCTASLLDAANCSVQLLNNVYHPVHRSAAKTDPVFEFVPVKVEIDDKGLTRVIQNDPTGTIHVFTTSDNQRYEKAMTDSLRGMLMSLGTNLPSAAPGENGTRSGLSSGR